MADSPVQGPLAGRTILVTRAAHQAAPLCRLLEGRGAETVLMPTIAIRRLTDSAPVQSAVARVADYDRLILTSANAVAVLGEALAAPGLRGLPRGLRLCAIGPRTAEAMEGLGRRPDLVASDQRAEGLLAMLPAATVRSERILLFRAAEARDILPRALSERGAHVDVVAAYQNVLPEPAVWQPGLQALQTIGVDIATFTSGSTARNFVHIVGQQLSSVLANVVIATIGPVTAQTCRELGMGVDVVAPRHGRCRAESA